MQPPPTLWHADSMYPNPGYRYTGNLKRGDSAQLVRQMCTNYPCIWSIACSSMSLLPVGTTGTLHYCKYKFYIQYVLYYRHKYILVSMHLRLSVRLSSIEIRIYIHEWVRARGTYMDVGASVRMDRQYTLAVVNGNAVIQS